MKKEQKITACAFIIDNGRVLVAKRALTKSFLPGKYELPGGHVEFGETAEECLKRELMEEMKIKIKVEMPFHAFTYLSDNKNAHSIEVDYFAHLKPSNQKIRINKKDHSDFKWIKESEIFQYFERNDEEARAIKNGFALLKKMK